MGAVAFGTVALIIVLSIFNGFKETIEGVYSSFDPELTISPKEGKVFVYDTVFEKKLKAIEGIEDITEVIVDNALIKYRGLQKVVQLKGVSNNFLKQTNFESKIIEGKGKLQNKDKNFAIIGLGIQYELGISLENEFAFIQCWYPNRKVKHFASNPLKAFNRQVIYPGGVFQIEQEYDNSYVFVPLSFTKSLMGYYQERSSLELKVKKDFKIEDVKKELQQIIGDKFNVKTQLELHASLFKAMELEKVFAFLAIIVLVAIAAINIFFSCSMLVLEKRNDMSMLVTMGAQTNDIRSIFLIEGLLIGVTGTLIGVFFGFVFCFLQQQFKFLTIGGETSIINVVPVSMKVLDFTFVGISALVITLLASIQPAIKASKISTEGIKKL